MRQCIETIANEQGHELQITDVLVRPTYGNTLMGHPTTMANIVLVNGGCEMMRRMDPEVPVLLLNGELILGGVLCQRFIREGLAEKGTLSSSVIDAEILMPLGFKSMASQWNREVLLRVKAGYGPCPAEIVEGMPTNPLPLPDFSQSIALRSSADGFYGLLVMLLFRDEVQTLLTDKIRDEIRTLDWEGLALMRPW